MQRKKVPSYHFSFWLQNQKVQYLKTLSIFLPCVSKCCPLGSNPKVNTLNRLQANDRTQQQGEER